MGVEEAFQDAVEDWIDYCRDPEVQLSSSPAAVNDCHAYRTIVKMGRDALPSIRKIYDQDYGEGGLKKKYSTMHIPPAQSEEFIQALFAHQRGETPEVSEAGRKKMVQLDKAEDDRLLALIKGHGLVSLVSAIVGDRFQIPEGIRGELPAMTAYTKRWLDKHLEEYA